jgi:putative nucleotidyltransferase with HDIG domain
MQLFSSGWAMLVAAVVVAIAEHFFKHKPIQKVVYNTCQHSISVWAGTVVYTALGGVAAFASVGSEGSLRLVVAPAPVIAAVVTYFVLNITAVSIAVSLSQGLPMREVWLRIGGSSFLNDLASSPLGILLAFLFVKLGMLGLVILLVPLYFVRHTYYVNVQLEEANQELLELMVKAIEARDPYTSGHSQRVSQIAEALGRALGLTGKAIEDVRTAALLHDVGKIHEVYAPLLRKEGKLDATERALMQTHAARSAELVGTISKFRGAIADAVRYHHENFDGTGYPTGLAGTAIPLASRVIMIADTVDAMTTDRPYRKALDYDRVASELQRCAGTQFDPDLVRTFLGSASIRLLVDARTKATPISDLPSMTAATRRWGLSRGSQTVG